MATPKFLRIGEINEISPPGLDGHKYRVAIQVGDLQSGNFHAEKDHVVTVTTSGTLQAVWGQTDAEVAQSSLSAVSSILLKAIAEDELASLEAIQLNSYTAPKTPPLEPIVAPGALFPVRMSPPRYEQPRGLSILSENAAEIRDQINAIAQALIGERLFELPQERAILAIYSPTRDDARSQLKVKPVAEMIMRPFSIELKRVAWQE